MPTTRSHVEPQELNDTTALDQIAALLGANGEWDVEYLESIADIVGLTSRNHPGDVSGRELSHYAEEADKYDIEWENDDICSEDGCYETLDDGEGYDGLCGTHADQAEEDE